MKTVTATLMGGGGPVQYVETEDPPAGGMKKTYFSPDRSQVVQFFHDESHAYDPQRIMRLLAILTKYNPTLPEDQGGATGVTPASAEYFKKLFCWPTGIVDRPTIGIVAPTYPGNYFFATGQFKGQEKQGKWFSSPKLRKYLPPHELGSWIGYFSFCILIARAVRRLHQAGLSHSDLSPKNVLVDPVAGTSVVIDIDSLVVPDLYPPDVLGTPGYIAPEVLTTMRLKLNDPRRKHPCAYTDLHALPVLLYEYLLLRHPLRGPQVHSNQAEEDEYLSMGPKALFIEHPSDESNAIKTLRVKYPALGPLLEKLFYRAFVEGLHAPEHRPAAIEWERGLIRTWDMLFPCPNPSCSHKWFVIHDFKRVQCPFCRTKPAGTIPVLKLRKETRPGNWMQDSQLVIYNNISLFKWHAFDNVFPGEAADRTPQAYCAFHEGRWLLVNQQLTSLTSPAGQRVPPGHFVELKHGSEIRLSQDSRGRIAEVELIRP
jgi:hypothetical protein